MKQIELTQDKFAIVDDNIYEELNQYKWYSQKGRKTYYARRMLPRNNKKRAMISMHHMILGKPEKGFEIDHINGNGAKQFRKLKRRGTSFYSWLRKEKFPVGYQTLCVNCQWIKRYEKGEHNKCL